MSPDNSAQELPLPSFYNPERVGQFWKVPYDERATQARAWAQKYSIRPAALDRFKVSLICIDVQNTFCLPEFELFVAGRSGRGAIDDNQRLVAFIYRNLDRITRISATMDTHRAMQIFHPIFLVNEAGENPPPFTLVTLNDIRQGCWKFNDAIADSLGIAAGYGQQHLLHYVKELARRGKYDLTIWPYHAMLGGIGHALVSAFEEAIFFHAIARNSQPHIETKGDQALTEHYSAVGPEILTGSAGEQVGFRSKEMIQQVMAFDAVIIAGQAKSHCVAWTITDLLDEIHHVDESLADKVYLLEDCASPVVIPGFIDYTQLAKEAYQRFAAAGMHLVRSTDALDNWPGFRNL